MTYVGVDWAGGLWMVVAIEDDVTIATEPSMLNVWEEWGAAADSILVDIPIGLPESGERACDRAASALLSDRSSTVFSIPCRDAVQAPTYEAAQDACDGSVGSQSWWLFPRINEVDVFLQTIDDATSIVYESHPEVCFAAYEGTALSSKSDEQGLGTRIAVLKELNDKLHETVERAVTERRDGAPWHDRLSQSRRDDIVDAAVLAGTAEHIGLGSRDIDPDYPALPGDDYTGPGQMGVDPRLGIEMEIVVPEEPRL